MSSVGLLTPILNGGIQNVNFVNGRVLTAEDLTAERAGNLQRQRLIANTVGEGVACGLEVTLSSNSVPYGNQVVQVTAGLAVNRNGDMLQLPTCTNITLNATLPAASANGGLFQVCQPPQTQLTNPGIYVLTVMPASGYQGSAPVTQLNFSTTTSVANSCTSRFATAGVQFRLAPVTLATTGTGLQPTLYALGNNIQTQLNNGVSAATLAPLLSQFRNGLAYACFGVDQIESYPSNPFEFFTQTTSYGLIDQARDAGAVTNCEVTLALIFWTPGGVQFIDMWSVRRRVTRGPTTEQWPLLAGDRRRSEAEAMFLQFEDHIQTIVANEAGLAAITADSHFLYLPAAGVLPVTANGIAALNSSATPSTPALDLLTFFGAHASKDVATTDGDLLREIFSSALDHEPIQLATTGELQLYLVWENIQAINGGANLPLAALFASPALRYRGIPRFTPSTDSPGPGTARWSLSRFAPHVI